MSEDRLEGHVRQIDNAIRDILRYVEGMDEAEFLEDELVRRTVILCLLIVGEAAAKIMDRYPTFANDNPHLPWRAMRGMRNRIAHRYFDIDLSVVWKTVRNELPLLANAVSSLAKTIEIK